MKRRADNSHRAFVLLVPGVVVALLGSALGQTPPLPSRPIARFGAELSAKLDGSANHVVSPASIATVMAMAYSGAQGKTAEQIAATMHFGFSPEEAPAAFASIAPAGKRPHYWLGARGEENEGYGIMVTEVVKESPAARIGLKPKDLILAIDDRQLRTESDYALAIDQAEDKIRVQFFSYERGVVETRTVELARAPQGAPAQLEIVRALWAQEGYTIHPGYLNALRRSFRGELSTVDFILNPAQSRQRINGWVEEKTCGRISELLGPQAITPETRLVMTDSLYFKGEWALPFLPEEGGLFWKHEPSSDKPLRVPGMARAAVFNYLQRDSFQLLELPYKGSSFALVVILPDASRNWEQCRRELHSSACQDLFAGLKPVRVRVVLPKFRISTKIALDEILRQSMPIAFSEDADFGGITNKHGLRISTVVHSAFINVDEKGTEAGAATAIGAQIKQPFDVEFKADRPFVFVLRDRASNTVYFVGQLVKPDRHI